MTAISPQEVLWAPGLGNGEYGVLRPVLDREGGPLKTWRRAFAVHLADWNGDGHPDLFVRLHDGAVAFHAGSAGGLHPNVREVVTEGEVPAWSGGSSAPWVCDWDHDGDQDLLTCADDGSIALHRNPGTRRLPGLAAPESLSEAMTDVSSARFCVTDWNLDGLDDVLVNCWQKRTSEGVELTEAEAERLAAAEREVQRLLADLDRLNKTRPDLDDQILAARLRKREQIDRAMCEPRATRDQLREKREGKSWTEIRLYLLRRVR